MPNGKFGDHPITDLLFHKRHPFPKDIESIIKEIFVKNNNEVSIFNSLKTKPFDWENGKNLEEARSILNNLLEEISQR